VALIVQSAHPGSALAASRTAFAWYSAFGLHIASQVRLPLAEVAPSGGDAAWSVVWANGLTPPATDGTLIAETRCEETCHAGEVINRVHRGPSGTWIWSRDTGRYHVSTDARRVTVYPELDADERAVGLVLLGQIAIFVLHQLGYASLHASAVLLDGQAVAFVGPPGAGKSTMAGCFLRESATLLTDDVLPLDARPDGIYGLPGAPLMKVWSETATHTLGIDAELPDLTSLVTKKLLRLEGRFAFAMAPARVRAIYLLARYDPQKSGQTSVTIRHLSQREAFPLLLAQSPRCEMLFARESARLLPLYARLMAQAPVRTLRIPHGFEHHATVRANVLADLEAQP
jgi:hypothetical protein